MKHSKIYIPMVVFLVCIANVYAQDWPQYLGPNRNSLSNQKDILRSWPQQGPEVLWVVDVGIGFGGPVVKDGKVVGIDPLTGEILWEYTNWQCRIPIPSAFDAGESKVFIIGGYEAGAAMIKVEKKADGSYGVTELYKTIEFGAHTKPAILYDGYFYAQYSTNERRDGLVCMSLDGQIMWKTKRSPQFMRGSMILADGLILATDGEQTLYLIEPDPSEFKPLASTELLVAEPGEDQMVERFGTQNWAPIALADGKLLIRDQTQLKCVKVARNLTTGAVQF